MDSLDEIANHRGRSSDRIPTVLEVTGPTAAEVTVTASGPLDGEATDRFADAITTALRHVADGIDRIRIDLTAVTTLSLEGPTPLIRLAHACQIAELVLQIAASRPVRARIRTTGLAGLLPCTIDPQPSKSLQNRCEMGGAAADRFLRSTP